MTWTAEITNNPDRDYDLYIELLEGDEYKARIQRSNDGDLELIFYGGERLSIPVVWLLDVFKRASVDLK